MLDTPLWPVPLGLVSGAGELLHDLEQQILLAYACDLCVESEALHDLAHVG